MIDSGIDDGHPEFAGRIVGGRLVRRRHRWKRDTDGHGTFVAGEIAADPDNGIGIAGLAFNAQLLIAKVVQPDGNVSPAGRGRGDPLGGRHGARGDQPQPRRRARPGRPSDRLLTRPAERTRSSTRSRRAWSSSRRSATAPSRRRRRGRTPTTRRRCRTCSASSALRQNGSVPDYSNRDPQYVDIAAPGDPIFSTIPRNLVDATQPGCAGAAVLELRPVGVPRRDRHVVRGAAGRGRRGALCSASTRSSRPTRSSGCSSARRAT